MRAAFRAFVVRVSVAAVLLLAPTPALAQQPSLAQLQFDIVGVKLVVDPPALTVPKNIATQINTSLALPAGADPSALQALAQLASESVVEAELRGPELTPTTLRVQPGQPIPLPAFALPGDYFLEGVRLVKDGVPLLDAQAADGRPATTIPIRVIGDILVASVTSRPLSLDEIRSKGIVIDDTNFKTVNFQVAFNIDGQPFTIDLPAALPTPDLLKTPASREMVRIELARVNKQLQTTLTKLPAQLDRPGLNFSIAALPFFPVLQEDEEPGFEIPPITGLVVIPGNVAFLNQFFSVLLMVTNVAPDGTPLVVRGVTGTVTLPTGLDRVAGTYPAPGDDPLRLARIGDVGVQPTVAVRQAGPDGEFGTADDLDFLAPQRMGQGEFLIEGLKEGGHSFDIAIRGTLEGLPSGPVEVEGLAAGAVFVRNPTFSVSLAHPRTIRAGEPYDLYATVTNTSQSVANLVTVGLDQFAISGAELLSPPSVTFETVASGDSVVAKFRLRAQRTGEVTFSSFTGDAAGDIRLTTGVDERGVPLAPNAIVLPSTTDLLPSSLVLAAQRVLGQAFSIATAPAEALPPGVLFVKRQTVVDRGVELAEAGQRVQFGGPAELERAIRDLALDWLGGRVLDEGFDQLLRTTDAGRDFLAEIAAVLGPSFLASPLDAQRAFAASTVARGAQLSVAGGVPAGGGPSLALVLSQDGVGDASASGNALPTAGVFPFGDPRVSMLTAVARPDAARYVLEARASAAGVFDLGAVVPGADAGSLVQLRFAAVPLGAGGVARLVLDLTTSGPFQLQIDTTGDGTTDATRTAASETLLEGPPQVVDIVQLESSSYGKAGDPRDPATYGLLVGVLFDKPVTEASAETVGNYAIEGGNSVIGVQLQPSGRLAYLYLEKPIGGLAPRALTVSGVADGAGRTVASVSRTVRTTFTDGVRVLGQVREAGGKPVPGAYLRFTTPPPLSFTIAAIRADAAGAFELDFVPMQVGTLGVTAQHPGTREVVSLNARLRAPGDAVLLNPTFLGKGTLRGRVIAPDGITPLPGVPVALIPGQTVSSSGYQTTSNALGEYQFAGIDVGAFTIVAADATGLAGRAVGLIPTAGSDTVLDVVLTDRPEDGGRVVGRVFLSDGVTPAANFNVYIGSYSRSASSIDALDRTTTDDTGSFAFPTLIPASETTVVAVDPGSGQIGLTRVTPVARTTTSVAVVMEATGTVEGVVFDASGVPVAGAVVAGGLALVTTDFNGFYRVTDVPAGRRVMEAGDPFTRKRGSATVDVVAGQTVTAAITLEARATIRGRVLDANGRPVPFASVRIPEGGGYTFVIANSQGVYTFPDLGLGDYLIQSPGPSKEALIEFMEANGIDPNLAFTSGDGPGSPEPTGGDADAVIAAYQKAVQNFFSVDESILSPPPMADLGGFGYTRASLFQDGAIVTRDIRFLPQGFVEGTTRDASGRPTGALVRIRGLKVGLKGHPLFFELERKNSDAQTGAFRFDRVPRFDQETFQTAGVRGGDFQVEAATPFSPVIASAFGQLNTVTPNVSNLVVQFPSAAETNGTVSGLVLMPDGVTPAPQGTAVRISFGDLTVTTGPDGRFKSVLPIPAGGYTLTAEAPSGGLRGQVSAAIPAGGNIDVQIRLLGLGTVLVTVQKPGGELVPDAIVEVRRATFPGEVLQGRTDAQGRVRFVNVSEGPFGVLATQSITGLNGRTNGTATRDGETTAVVTIIASGRVTGTFRTATGVQTIPFAQVTLAGPAVAYATTDGSGRFEMTAIPVGDFTIEAFDPLTGRRGRATGRLSAEGQAVDVTVLQLPRGTVEGFVVGADGGTRIPAASVQLIGGSFVQTALIATTRPDGSFRFEGVPAGTFTLKTEDPVSGARGEATGTLTSEGETADVTIVLEPFGSVLVTVRAVDGAISSNASVALSDGRSGTTDASGQVRFENLRLGSYTLVARSLAESRDAGRATVKIESANQQVDLTITLGGVAPLTVDVQSAAGVPVSSASVVVNSLGATGGAAGPGAATLNGFTDDAGRVVFPAVAPGDFTVLATSALLAGAATGTIAGPGQAAAISVRLSASGSITGRVVLPNGTTPAAQAIVTLRFTSQTQQPGALQRVTGLDGRFTFASIPLGAFSLDAFEIVTQGVRTRTGSLTAGGQIVDLGDLVLDNEAPRVTAVNPADGALNVPETAPITITFNEPMNPLTVTAANVRLLSGATTIATTSTLSADGTTLTVAPVAPLVSGTQYTLSILGAPNGPKDISSLSLIDPFVSAFTVRDSVPPVITSVFPAQGAKQVLPEAVVRVTFSEPVASATLVLRDAANQPVAGAKTLTLGNTVAVYSPTQFLQANTFYTVEVSQAKDLAGNALAGVPVSTSFATVDTMAPVIAALQLAGTPRVGLPVTITPQIAASDVQRVEFTIDGVPPIVATTPPYTASFSVPSGRAVATVNAVAVDLVGNRSPVVVLPIAILENQPPAVTLVNVNSVTNVGQGDTVAFDVVATDDEGVASVRFTAGGAASLVTDRAVPGTPASTTQRFTVTIPATASSTGSLSVQAAAFDAAGLASAPASLVLPLRDGARPTVTIVSPAAGSQVAPGGSIVLVVDAADDVALASIQVACTPASLSGCETRAISGQASRQTFTLGVPASLVAPQAISLVVNVTDAAGNTGSAGRSLSVTDTVVPAVTSLVTVNGATRVVEGETVTLRATATDNVALQSVLFTATSGAFSTSRAVAVSGTSGTANFDLVVPTGLAAGAQLTVTAVARDAASLDSTAASLVLTVGDTAPPAVEITLPAAGAEFASGGAISFRARGTDDTAVKQLEFKAAGAVTFSQVVTVAASPSAEDGVSIPVPAAAVGNVTLSARAIDAAGNASPFVERTVSVVDRTAPSVAVTSPLANAEFDPRNVIPVTVNASDNIGVSEIALARVDANGAVTPVETRAVQPPVSPRTENFSVTLPAPAPVATTVVLRASARDAAGNATTAQDVVVRLADVVAPSVSSTSPADGETGVDPGTAISIAFSEPMNPATLTGAFIVLRNGATPVSAAVTVGGGNAAVLVSPSQPLAVNTLFTVALTGVKDTAGNALPATSVTFRTASPDVASPKVSSIDPANNSVGAGAAAPVTVTFTEAIDPATVTAASFRVSVDGAPVAGTLTFLDGNTRARFTPAASYGFEKTVVVELTGAIRDTSNNPLVNADGTPVTTPITFTFLTGNFAITSPAGASVVEKSVVAIEAQAAASLAPASVVFTVNGTALPADTSAPFGLSFTVPAASAASTLTIVASARNASDAEIARAEKTFTVVPGLQIAPRLLGVPRGAQRTLTLSLAEPAAADVAIALSSGNAAVATVSPSNVSIQAGQRSVNVTVTACATCPNDDSSRADEALGNTSIVATSSRGTVASIVSVSDPVAGRSVTAFDLTGVAIARAPSIGQIVLPAGRSFGTLVQVMSSAAGATTTVAVFSSNPSVATATASPVQAGQVSTTVDVQSLSEGVTTLTLRAGDEVRSLVVVVGNPAPGQTPPVLAMPVGFSVIAAPSVGQLVLAAAQNAQTLVSVLSAALAGNTPLAVSVSSSNPAVATGTATAIQPGSQSTTLSIAAVANGRAVLTLRAGDAVRSVTIVVGTPTPDQTPVFFAQAVGVNVVGTPFIGKAFVPAAQGGVNIGVLLLPESRAVPTSVSLSSSNPAVAAVAQASVVIPAGERVVPLTINSGANGTARITIRTSDLIREFDVVVGSGPTPSNAPVIAALGVGVSVAPLPGMGRLGVAPGAPVTATLGVQVVSVAGAADRVVTVRSSNAAVVAVGAVGVSSTTATLPAGAKAAPISLVTSGAVGTAVITFEVDGVQTQMVVVVGDVPASQQPAITAPVLGVKVG